MALTKARLNRWDQIVGLEVRHELVSDDLFDDLGDERDIGNRSEVAWVSWIKSRTFDDGDQNRSFLVQRHDSFYDGSIANCGEEWQQNVKVLLQEECRQGIEFARLRSSGNDDATQFSRGDSRHSRQDAGRGWKRRRRRASGAHGLLCAKALVSCNIRSIAALALTTLKS